MPEDIEFIVVGTTTPDMFFPTVGNIVQHRLGCRRAGLGRPAGGVRGSIYSLAIGAQFIQTGKYRRVLCIGAETLSKITDFTDRGTCILLADAAGAAVLEATEDEPASSTPTSIRTAVLGSPVHARRRRAPPGHPGDASEQRMHYAKMKGNEVFKVAVRMFVECAETDPSG